MKGREEMLRQIVEKPVLDGAVDEQRDACLCLVGHQTTRTGYGWESAGPHPASVAALVHSAD